MSDTGVKDHRFFFLKDGEAQEENDSVGHVQLCLGISLTHPILQPLFMDLADFKRQSLAFKDEIPYLYQSRYRHSTVGPDSETVLEEESMKRNPPSQHMLNVAVTIKRSESRPAVFE